LNVDITSYQENVDYSKFVGFTYILPCRLMPLSENIITGGPH
jgi:hypothetical protein